MGVLNRLSVYQDLSPFSSGSNLSPKILHECWRPQPRRRRWGSSINDVHKMFCVLYFRTPSPFVCISSNLSLLLTHKIRQLFTPCPPHMWLSCMIDPLAACEKFATLPARRRLRRRRTAPPPAVQLPVCLARSRTLSQTKCICRNGLSLIKRPYLVDRGRGLQ